MSREEYEKEFLLLTLKGQHMSWAIKEMQTNSEWWQAFTKDFKSFDEFRSALYAASY